MSGPEHRKVRRAFLSVDGRQVHYRMLGKGPPALFIHSSPTNSLYVLDDMRAQADDYTCFAFDTPGFGLSDPLPLAEMKVADLAHAIAAATDALGLPPLPVFGTHSGAAIGLELGYLYPEKVTGLMLDGVPVFTRAEVAPMHGEYFAPLVADVLGGHYSATWTRFRDQNIWFPWCFRSPQNLNETDLRGADNIHGWLEMFFAAAAHYKPAYFAVTSYCEEALTAVAGLTVPAVFTATATDMLHPHLQRLPPLRATQAIVEIGHDIGFVRKRQLTGDSFARFGSPGIAPTTVRALASSDRIRRQFVDDDGRAQMLRFTGDLTKPPLLLLHDTPGSSRRLEARMLDLAADHFVIAPDLPGSGESDGLGEAADMADYAAAIVRMLDLLGAGPVAIEGHGFGASLGVELAASAPDRCTALAIDGLLLPDAAQRADLLAYYAPPLGIEFDGAHWYRLWLRLRDSLVYWPWYDSRRVALRRAPTQFEAWDLHDWTTEVMKQRAAYPHYINAALRHDAGARLSTCIVPIRRIADPLSALGAAYGEALDALLSGTTAAAMGQTDA